MREYFPHEYDKIAALNIDLSKSYQRERDTNDAPDEVIDKLISFDPKYIDKTITDIKNINDKALFAVLRVADSSYDVILHYKIVYILLNNV